MCRRHDACQFENWRHHRTWRAAQHMCTLAIYFQMTDDYPIVIAANRDEYLDRPAAKPTTLCARPHVVGGKDLRAGGTWLGVNEYGLVAGLLNRRTEAPPNPDARSRGLLAPRRAALPHRARGRGFRCAAARGRTTIRSTC